ncbi:hypothetical protein AGR7C_Lc80220 [Agrobacterium deltaense Zutra 3/1]|uniref:Uncharacterized protein n=1 Tax=Agrobacterium deltaense Zutra 3/1 TaxID=1183427 RepID=A0A1S7S178_9HYPH|nr:hypothetical protein AGR7C_Lc80220 [Agrobacterium deltaense Zutra 3/1]
MRVSIQLSVKIFLSLQGRFVLSAGRLFMPAITDRCIVGPLIRQGRRHDICSFRQPYRREGRRRTFSDGPRQGGPAVLARLFSQWRCGRR